MWDARPDRMREWLGGEGDIELELAEGGKYHARTTGPPELVEAIIAEGGEEALTRHDTVLRVEPPTVFEHTFGDPDSVVRWELQTDGDGCRLKLTHTEPPDFAISEHGPRDLAGWHTLLEQLTQVLDGTATGWSKERWEELRDEYAAKWS